MWARHVLLRFAAGLRNFAIHIRNDLGHFRTSAGERVPETHANVDVSALTVETMRENAGPCPETEILSQFI